MPANGIRDLIRRLKVKASLTDVYKRRTKIYKSLSKDAMNRNFTLTRLLTDHCSFFIPHLYLDLLAYNERNQCTRV